VSPPAPGPCPRCGARLLPFKRQVRQGMHERGHRCFGCGKLVGLRLETQHVRGLRIRLEAVERAHRLRPTRARLDEIHRIRAMLERSEALLADIARGAGGEEAA
jgi:uncharacterized Zn finger protein